MQESLFLDYDDYRYQDRHLEDLEQRVSPELAQDQHLEENQKSVVRGLLDRLPAYKVQVAQCKTMHGRLYPAPHQQ